MVAQDILDLRSRAARKLDAQRARAARFQTYYDGDPSIIAILDREDRMTFTTLLREARANWCELVVNAVAERLQVVGFQFGSQASDDRAWAIWQASQMDADADLVQTDALTQSAALVLIQADEDNPTGVTITGESALDSCVIYQPGSRRKRLAGYKRYREDPDQNDTEILITADSLYTWTSATGNPVVETNPAGLVNLLEMQPQPRTLAPPRSELEPAIPFQDRINTTIFNRLVATDYGAFRQIWARGIKMARQQLAIPPGDGPAPTITVPVPGGTAQAQRALPAAAAARAANGAATVPVKPFNVGADRLLVAEDPAAMFGSFPESTLSGYLNSVEQDVQHLAAISQTPPHYLLGEMVNISADAIKAAESGLVAKIRRRARYIGEAWEEAMRIALGMVGDPGAVNVAAEVQWADFETRSEAQLMDALTKAQALGVPQEEIWRRYGASPQQIPEWQRLNTAAAATAAINQAAALGAIDPYAQAITGSTG